MKLEHKFEQYMLVIVYHNFNAYETEIGIERKFFKTHEEAYTFMALMSVKYKNKIMETEVLSRNSFYAKYRKEDEQEWSMCMEIIDCSVNGNITFEVE